MAGEILPLHPWCVFVYVSVSFLHFFFCLFLCKISTGHMLYFHLASLNRRRWRRSHFPPPHLSWHHLPYLIFFLCVSTADGANKQTNIQTNKCFRGVGLLLLSANEKAQAALLNPAEFNQTELTDWKKGMPNVHRSLRLSCFFLYRLPLVILF